jgi:hypothetical protein
VDEYLKGRKAFEKGSAVRDPSIVREARASYQKTLETALTEEYQLKGFSPRKAAEEAAKEATETMKTLAALHNPDMVAGGKDTIQDFGNRNVNSRIGAQWKKGERLVQLDKAARAIPATLRGTAKMNAKLERCK